MLSPQKESPAPNTPSHITAASPNDVKNKSSWLNFPRRISGQFSSPPVGMKCEIWKALWFRKIASTDGECMWPLAPKGVRGRSQDDVWFRGAPNKCTAAAPFMHSGFKPIYVKWTRNTHNMFRGLLQQQKIILSSTANDQTQSGKGQRTKNPRYEPPAWVQWGGVSSTPECHLQVQIFTIRGAFGSGLPFDKYPLWIYLLAWKYSKYM